MIDKEERKYLKSIGIDITVDGRMRLKDAAKYLGVSQVTVWRKLSKLGLKQIRLGKTIFYAKDDLDDFINKSKRITEYKTK